MPQPVVTTDYIRGFGQVGSALGRGAASIPQAYQQGVQFQQIQDQLKDRQGTIQQLKQELSGAGVPQQLWQHLGADPNASVASIMADAGGLKINWENYMRKQQQYGAEAGRAPYLGQDPENYERAWQPFMKKADTAKMGGRLAGVLQGAPQTTVPLQPEQGPMMEGGQFEQPPITKRGALGELSERYPGEVFTEQQLEQFPGYRALKEEPKPMSEGEKARLGLQSRREGRLAKKGSGADKPFDWNRQENYIAQWQNDYDAALKNYQAQIYRRGGEQSAGDVKKRIELETKVRDMEQAKQILHAARSIGVKMDATTAHELAAKHNVQEIASRLAEERDKLVEMPKKFAIPHVFDTGINIPGTGNVKKVTQDFDRAGAAGESNYVFSAYRALKEAGFDVPEEALGGSSGLQGGSNRNRPPLSSFAR